jgi:hypothetical protein
MRALLKLLAIGGAAGAVAIAAPASAQYYPGYPYGYGYGYPYGGNVVGQVLNDVLGNGYRYGPSRQVAVNQCTGAAQARLGYSGGRVVGVSQVLPRGDGGFTIRGVAASGRYAYGYAAASPDLTWRCVTDLRGFVREVTLRQANYGYGYNYSPYDYSQFGYRRY